MADATRVDLDDMGAMRGIEKEKKDFEGGE
jgi:hypothetical protein